MTMRDPVMAISRILTLGSSVLAGALSSPPRSRVYRIRSSGVGQRFNDPKNAIARETTLRFKELQLILGAKASLAVNRAEERL